jgi:hypothetical protein
MRWPAFVAVEMRERIGDDILDRHARSVGVPRRGL